MSIENPTQEDKNKKEMINRIFDEAFRIMTERDQKMMGRTLDEERQNEFDNLTWQLKSKIEFLRKQGVWDTDPKMKQLLDSLDYPKPRG